MTITFRISAPLPTAAPPFKVESNIEFDSDGFPALRSAIGNNSCVAALSVPVATSVRAVCAAAQRETDAGSKSNPQLSKSSPYAKRSRRASRPVMRNQCRAVALARGSLMCDPTLFNRATVAAILSLYSVTVNNGGQLAIRTELKNPLHLA